MGLLAAMATPIQSVGNPATGVQLAPAGIPGTSVVAHPAPMPWTCTWSPKVAEVGKETLGAELPVT